MYDSVNFWMSGVDVSGGNPFEVLPHLSETTERQNEKHGYSCSGKVAGYDVCVYQWGMYLNGSLAKSYFNGDNSATLTRRATQNAVEQLSDLLHTDMRQAKVIRVDVSTVIPTRRPPSDYYGYLGMKPHFTRVQATDNTLYYNNHQRQIVFYDKAKEAKNIPELLQNNNLFRYELRFLRRIKSQLKADVTAQTLYDELFYQSIVQRWYNEFKSIQKIKEHNFMTENITTVKDAESALFAYALQQLGQSTIDVYLNELKAKKTFKDPKYYSRLKTGLNKIIVSRRSGQKSELMTELENDIWNVAKYAR